MGAGRSLRMGVLAALVACPSLACADVENLTASRFGFDCSTTPLALDDSVRQTLSEIISKKWNIGIPTDGELQSKLTVRLCLSEDGRPENLILLAADGPHEESVTQLYAAARRAILRTAIDGGLPLPPDNDDTRRVLDLVFDANGMRTE